MKTFDAPKWMIDPFREHGICRVDYYVYGAGRALGFVRMAAHALGELSNEQKIAEYHSYAGISADRTAIDAIASWLNAKLELGVKQGPGINLSFGDFRGKALANLPESSKEHVEHLGELGREIDLHRQRAQHREGLALVYHEGSEESDHRGGWYLAPKGLSGDRALDLRLADLLGAWADKIEGDLRAIHTMVIGTSSEHK